MPRQQPDGLELSDRRTVRTIEVHGGIPGGLNDGASLTVSWERWDGHGTADRESVPDGKPLRPDYELAFGFFGFGGRASWGTSKRNSNQFAQLAGTDLNVHVIRAYGMLLLELAQKVEGENAADAAYFREHDRIVRRRSRRTARV